VVFHPPPPPGARLYTIYARKEAALYAHNVPKNTVRVYDDVVYEYINI